MTQKTKPEQKTKQTPAPKPTKKKREVATVMIELPVDLSFDIENDKHPQLIQSQLRTGPQKEALARVLFGCRETGEQLYNGRSVDIYSRLVLMIAERVAEQLQSEHGSLTLPLLDDCRTSAP